MAAKKKVETPEGLPDEEIKVGYKTVYEENEEGDVVPNNMNESAIPRSEAEGNK